MTALKAFPRLSSRCCLYYFLILIGYCLLSSICGSLSSSEDLVLYTDIYPVNASDSLARIKQLPIIYYKFLYDSIPDRIQLGVIGAQVQSLFPESIEVIPSTAFAPTPKNLSDQINATSSSSSRTTNTPIIVTNFPVVDKTVLFMHGLAAVQELIVKYETLNNTLTQLLSLEEETLIKEYQQLESYLQRELTYQQQEQFAIQEERQKQIERQIQLEEKNIQTEALLTKKQLEIDHALLTFEENLVKERLLRQEEITKENLAQQMKFERELAEKKDLLQRQTAEKMQAVKLQRSKDLENRKLQLEKEKIKAEIEAKSSQERMQEEIALRKIQTQAKLDTERMVQGIKNISLQISTILRDLFSRPYQMLALAGIFLALIACYFLIREFATLIRQFIQNRFGKPTLVRETSRQWTFWSFLLSWIPFLGEDGNELTSPERLASRWKSLEKEFADVILSSEDKARVINLALATRNTRLSGAPYRHILLHGPPGTGKTLIARRLARSSNMDYAILSGGDVAPLGEDAVNQLHELFQWANRSRKGLLVFIDEAEAFLSSRAGNMGEGFTSDGHVRNALNALLYQTGTPSKHFMMVLATNRPEDLDSAILDRIDVSLQVSLPGIEQRVQLVDLYLDLYLTQVAIASKRSQLGKFFFGQVGEKGIEDSCLGKEALQEIAKMIEGFSGREIAKLFISAQYAMFLAPKQRITWTILQELVQSKVQEHQMKASGFSMK